jgi:plastocyanin
VRAAARRAAALAALASGLAACSAGQSAGPGSAEAGDGDVLTDGIRSLLCSTAAFADCQAFTDWTAAGNDRTIRFSNYQYTPRCTRISSGQAVTFTGDFVVHPLAQACGPADVLEHRLPIDAMPGTEMSVGFTLWQPGLYGYYCLDHGTSDGAAMSGAIVVDP